MKARFTPEVRQFIIDHVKGLYDKELCELVNKEFNTSYTVNQIGYFKTNHKLSSGLTGYFEKGSVPPNKGKKWDEYLTKEQQEKARTTCFKKSDHSFNKADWKHKPVGYEYIGKDGYVIIKIAEPNKWQLKHRYIYEQHYGKIPKGYVCIFLDGNKRNFDINNLAIVTMNQHHVLNQKKLRFETPEATASGIELSKLYIKLYERKNKKK
jgi:hypothetical protein